MASNDVNSSKIRHVFGFNCLTEERLACFLQIYKAQWFYVIFTAENSKLKMKTILSKKTNIEQKHSRYANKNKQQTSTEEIYIENDLQT